MPKYLLEHHHRPEECEEIYQEWDATKNAGHPLMGLEMFCTCPSGDHGSFTIVAADSPEDLLAALGPKLRERSRVHSGEVMPFE